jgi:predicted AAA+ superfamily ATPase
MTQEQKAKAYDEAIDKLQSLITNANKQGHIIIRIEDLENSFPELKESEDDRMREMAIKAVYAPQAQSCIKSWGINPDDVIAWLEKQGKKSVWTDNDRIMTFTLLRDVTQMTHLSNEGKNERLEWLNTLEDRF